MSFRGRVVYLGFNHDSQWDESDPMRKARSRHPDIPGPVLGRAIKKPPDAAGIRGLFFSSAGTLKKTLKLSTSHWVLKFPDGLGFDLADTLTRDLEDPAHFLERISVAVAKPIA